MNLAVPVGPQVLQARFLYCNTDSDLSEWIEQITPVLQSMFGHLASFIITDEYYVPAMPEPPDTPWTNANDPARVNRLVMHAKINEYAKSLTKLEDYKPRKILVS